MTNITALPARKKRPALDTESLAVGALWAERHNSNRAQAMSVAISRLQHHHDMPHRGAENAAAQAMAELDTVNTRDTLDVDATTSHGVVMRMEDGSRLLLTARDLRHLLNGRALNSASDALCVLHR